MDDFLTAVKTVRSQSDVPPESLTAVHTRQIDPGHHGRHPTEDITPRQKINSDDSIEHIVPWKTPQDALQVIRSQPSTATLVALLKQLASGNGFEPPFNLNTPGPNQAQILNALLNIVVPNFWPAFDKSDKRSLASCLSNVSGLNALVGKLRLQGGQPPNATCEGFIRLDCRSRGARVSRAQRP